MKESLLANLTITLRPTNSLNPYPGNARTHSKHQINQLVSSIREFGFVVPILIDKRNTIIAGHGRVQAAQLLGMAEVPTILLEGLTDNQIRAYVIADNAIASKSTWNNSILAVELQHLLTVDDQFDVTITGFEVAEIDLILQGGTKQDPDDALEPIAAGPAITRLGDLWLLGKHKILCGNALEETSFTSVMGGRKAHMVFADVPYNVSIFGNVSGKGVVKHADFAMACGEMSEAEFTKFLTESLGLLARHTVAGSVHFVCMDFRHMSELLAAGKEAYSDLLNLCVWVKNNGGQGSFYRSQHELVFVFRNGKTRNQNNVQLGKYGRYRTNVWEYPAVRGLSQMHSDEGNLLALHPTVKPVAMIADAILDCTARGNLVLDSFLGSGSTLIAAERMGRICYGIELDPHYVDVAIRRWQRYSGQQAVHASSGKRFEDLSSAVEVIHG